MYPGGKPFSKRRSGVARKLLCLWALITLAFLAQVAPGIASMYAVSGGSETTGIWTKIQGIDQEPTRFTITIVYDTFTTVGTIRLSINLPGLPVVSSSDSKLISAAQYSMEKEGGLFRGYWQEILYGSDHNRSNNASFILTATLTEVLEGGNHYGLMTSFSFSMSHADPLPSSVPLPGAVCLLGSGLPGLACLRSCLRT
jgi:hypothetical protein